MLRSVLRIGRFGLAILSLGLSVLAVHASFSQEVRLGGQGASTIWVASNFARGCEATIARGVLEQDMETQLRGAGVAVSRVHTATLTADVDCVPAIANGRTVAVHECLELSHRVSSQSSARGTIATTWQKCQSYRCGKGTCEARARAELHGLVDAFLGEMPKSSPGKDPPAQPTAVKPSAADIPISGSNLPLSLAAIYYLLYVMTCIAVVIHWEYRKLRAH